MVGPPQRGPPRLHTPVTDRARRWVAVLTLTVGPALLYLTHYYPI